MIQQIEEKVVNRLRQVTAAIKQDGANQVEHHHQHRRAPGGRRIRHKPAAMRPEIVGAALQQSAKTPTCCKPCSRSSKRKASCAARRKSPSSHLRSELMGQLLAAGKVGALKVP